MQKGARFTTVSFKEITLENQVQLQFMPKPQKMNIQYVLTIFKKNFFEWQMQLKLPRGDENVLVNL